MTRQIKGDASLEKNTANTLDEGGRHLKAGEGIWSTSPPCALPDSGPGVQSPTPILAA